MSAPDAPRQRDYARTRRQLLDAARTQVRLHGATVSLDAIGREAGVSKGGLLHHFRSKDELLVALAQDLYSAFETAVQELVQSQPAAPGRWVRAYVRATFAEIAAPQPLLKHGALLTLITTVPSVAEFVAAKLAHWSHELTVDGLAPEVVRLVMLACDGAAIAVMTGQQPEVAGTAGIEAHLLALIDAHAPIAQILQAAATDTENR